MNKKLTLIILDGWGHAEAGPYNAISSANPPYWNHLIQTYPYTTLAAHGEDVGVESGVMGNSEVGHLNIGAGRVVLQDSLRITREIQNGNFFKNTTLEKAIAQSHGHTLHVMGLLSAGCIHSHEEHIFAFFKMCAQKGIKNVTFHAFLDGRDTPPKSALSSLLQCEKILSEYGMNGIASISGRYFAMDRDKRYERTQKAYEALMGNATYHAASVSEALDNAYARGESDEFVTPTCIKNSFLADNDTIVFMNFRADRARQLCHAFVDPAFTHFKREDKKFSLYTLTPYATDLCAQAVFYPQNIGDGLGETLSKQGISQLRLAETEKYAHVTYFFNGGIEKPFPKEDRFLTPSAKVATYDLKPEMSAPEITQYYIEHIKNYDVFIVNFANADMVGHSGDFEATLKAIHAVDSALSVMIPAALQEGHIVAITADHGNADKMFDDHSNQAHTAHSLSPVPFLVTKPVRLKPGKLCDVAPTLLDLMEIPKPLAMTGESLIIK